MPRSQAQSTVAGVAALPGAALVQRIRRVAILSVIGALIYAALMRGSKGYCAGGTDPAGGFLDAAGRPVDEAPPCVQLTLGPSPLVFLGIALIVLLALGRVLRAADEAAALRVLDRAAIAVCALIVIAIVVSNVWFQLIPLEDLMTGSFSFFSPFPFGSIDVAHTSMPRP
ncbi:hypothetical protein [Microbacterium sp. JZ31]|uniref:hypothetical protein n=1 Tax=Microbacterium sp. JZ31 TaxID=1906274 RepID=UPI00193358AA|nr:hypothetical protein [Microbacterium sp. JZ31]